jgi:hypothetical protein
MENRSQWRLRPITGGNFGLSNCTKRYFVQWQRNTKMLPKLTICNSVAYPFDFSLLVNLTAPITDNTEALNSLVIHISLTKQS